MKQKQYSPLSVAEMALSLYAANEGFIDPVPVAKVVDYEEALHDFARANNQADLDAMNESGDYNDDVVATLKGICEAFAEKGAY
jgi:F-type H+-transporting ATPase subunit alpha